MLKRELRFVAIMLLTVVSLVAVAVASGEGEQTQPMFPTDIKVSEGRLFVTTKGAKTLYVYNTTGEKISSILFEHPLTGVAISGQKAYVTSSDGSLGQLSVVDIASGKIEKSVETGQGAKSPVISADNKFIYVLNQFKGDVVKVALPNLEVVSSVRVLREPFSAVLSKSGKYLFVNNFLPYQAASLDYVAADVSVIDVNSMTKVKDIKLDNGSNALRDITSTEDGKYVIVSHNLGRFQVPTSQLQQGWMNTSAISFINAETLEFMGSVVVDDPDHGAAGVWGVACGDGKIVVAQSGTHDISVIDYPAFIKKFEAQKDRSTLSYDLRFLYGIRDRYTVKGNGPRRLAIDGGKVYVPTYFSDTLNVMSLQDGSIEQAVAWNPNRIESAADKGERYFNDALYCFQNWQSCNGCHPGDARTDGMNWDLMNDGIGNSKNCKSMLFSHSTAPCMISGIRESAELAVRKGFFHIQFFDVTEEHATCVDEYLKSLRPLPSPYLVDGKLSALAEAGRKVFEQLKCDECHSGPYYTDLKLHRIGEDIEFDAGWDTPTLREVWRTAPYLFDGRATTIEEVFEVHRHGINGKLNKKDLQSLSEYVKSL